MPYFTYDSSVIISRKPTLPGKSSNFLWSAVVLMELTASAKDDSQRKVYESLFRRYREDNSLIIPNEDDWLLASKVLYLLSHDRRRGYRGKLKRLHPGVAQRMALDVLIAVSARRWRATVVMENWADFKLIERFAQTKTVKASLFFGKSNK
jgi:predicted nucleic acid-binding protein